MKAMFDCDYCSSTFKLERNYNKHRCEKMIRYEDIGTKRSKMAFSFYCEWMRLKHRIPPSKDTFINSRYYTTFFKFIDFLKQYAIANPTTYLKLMVSLKMEPYSWITLDVYRYYLDNFDRNTNPLEQASITVNTLIQLSKIFDCKIRKTIPKLEANEMIKLIQAKKLSPWILLFSKQFFHFLENNTTKEQKIILQTLIDPNRWRVIFSRKHTEVAQMKNIVEEMRI